MLEYTIESTELVPLMHLWDNQKEAQHILENSESDIPVKFVLLSTKSDVLRLLVFTYHRKFEHVDIARRYVWEWENHFFGAGKIDHIRTDYGRPVWGSISCEDRYGYSTPKIEKEAWEAILRQVKEKALACLTQIAEGEVSS